MFALFLSTINVLKDKFIAVYLARTAGGFKDEQEPNALEIDDVRREVQCFTLASHLFWSLWAIVNVYQEIEFGYWVSTCLAMLSTFHNIVEIHNE